MMCETNNRLVMTVQIVCIVRYLSICIYYLHCILLPLARCEVVFAWWKHYFYAQGRFGHCRPTVDTKKDIFTSTAPFSAAKIYVKQTSRVHDLQKTWNNIHKTIISSQSHRASPSNGFHQKGPLLDLPTNELQTTMSTLLTAIFLLFCPLLVFPTPLTPKPPLKHLYASLRDPPSLVPSSSYIVHLRYKFHRAYYCYLITFSGYMLSDEERLVLDFSILLLAVVTVWVWWVLGGILARSLFGTRLGTEDERTTIGLGEIGNWSFGGQVGSLGSDGVVVFGN
ncbi:unnamed protein product [Periconia digitata]|uniref:Uncharacterized protein n=1 Tax=Periconia digitata TaxID=1303443 RepID=A0A9W4U884_9PLEO|nr:unnamed protein product [Periconia digitata]